MRIVSRCAGSRTQARSCLLSCPSSIVPGLTDYDHEDDDDQLDATARIDPVRSRKVDSPSDCAGPGVPDPPSKIRRSRGSR